jgi:hypothetical protein
MNETTTMVNKVIEHTNVLIENICDLIMLEARKEAVPNHTCISITRLQELIDVIKTNKIEI